MARLACALVAFAVSMPATASAQQTSESFAGGADGSSLFRTYCASCHGKEAKGDGILADNLRIRPPDLTLLAKTNKGTFDADKVHRIIDGRQAVKGHGGPDMPVWGDSFRRSQEGGDEITVRERISAIVSYLESIQLRVTQ